MGTPKGALESDERSLGSYWLKTVNSGWKRTSCQGVWASKFSRPRQTATIQYFECQDGRILPTEALLARILEPAIGLEPMTC